MQQSEPYCSIFLMINSGSGGGIGQKLLAQEVEKISFDMKIKQITGHDEDEVVVYFYNMRKNRDKGFNKIKSLTQEGKKVITVVCGGDGTVMWVVTELIKYQIDTDKAPLAVIPLGTGNDFSRSLGWGKETITLTENSFETLKKHIRDYLLAEEEDLDIWQVSIKLYDYGTFEKVVDQKDTLQPEKSITKDFCNYFSFGIDGKVGYEFDKYRTKSRLGNLAVYGAMGIMSNFSKNHTLGELIDCILDNSDGVGDVIFHGEKVKSLQQLFGDNIFEIKADWGEVLSNVKNALTLNNFQNIVALNINSYMAGVKDIWKKASEEELLKRHNLPPVATSHSDGKIELVSFASTITIGLEKATNKFSEEVGFSQKVAQGKGPYYFKFRREAKEKDISTYLQIDGEFIRANHIDFIEIKKSPNIPGGKIRVLHRKEPLVTDQVPK